MVDAEPREVYVVSALLVPIIAIRLYPKFMTDVYKSSIDALVARDSAPLIREKASPFTVRYTAPTV